jgi:Mannosyltransferase (PIG-V)
MPNWLWRHPEIWISFVLYLTSCLLLYGSEKVAYWTQTTTSEHLANFCKWDCSWYSTITAHGYDLHPWAHVSRDAANWAFFPLFPMSAVLLKHLLRLDPDTATVLASKLELFGAIYAFLLWLRPHLEDRSQYFFAGALVAFNPYLIYAHAGYTEPLYFMLACLGFWALDQRNWILAGLFGAGLSANRSVGLFFVVAYIIVALRDVGWRGIVKDRSLRILTGLLLCPLGLVLFALYLHQRVGDALAFAHVQLAWGRHWINPVTEVAESLHEHGWPQIFAGMVVAGLLASLWLMRKYPELGIFLAISVVVPCASGTLYGFPRYLWWQPPFLFAIYFWLRRSVPASIVYFAFSGGWAAFMVLQWFAGHNFVV